MQNKGCLGQNDLAYWLTFSIKIAFGQSALRKFANFLTIKGEII